MFLRSESIIEKSVRELVGAWKELGHLHRAPGLVPPGPDGKPQEDGAEPQKVGPSHFLSRAH